MTGSVIGPRTPSVLNHIGGWAGLLKLRKSLEKPWQECRRLRSRQNRSETIVRPRAKGEVPARTPRNIETLRVRHMRLIGRFPDASTRKTSCPAISVVRPPS